LFVRENPIVEKSTGLVRVRTRCQSSGSAAGHLVVSSCFLSIKTFRPDNESYAITN